jgi:hypothetical protein
LSEVGWTVVGLAETQTPRAINLIALGVVAELTGLLATFMPMKSILILAADEIPAFFPDIFIRMGPAGTAFVLIVLSAIFGAISWFAKRIVSSLASPNALIKSSQFRHRIQATKSKRGLELVEATSLSLVAVLLVAGFLISILFASLVLAWVIGSLAVLSIQIHRSERRPPFATGAAEFSARFSKWASHSSLWSTVSAAIVTLLISPPKLGITGILLAAVLFTQLQRKVANLAPLVYDGKARLTHAEDPLLASDPARAVQNPAEFFATAAGLRTLTQMFNDLNLAQANWKVIGQPTRTQLSLIARHTIDGALRMVRIFAHGREDLMNKELQLRSMPDNGFLPGAWETHAQTIWGIPTIILRGDLPVESSLSVDPTREQLDDLQIMWEIKSLMSPEIPIQSEPASTEVLSQSIRNGLHVMSKLPGLHQEAVANLFRGIEPLLGTLEKSPQVISLGGRISDRNVVQYAPGHFTIIDVSDWRVVPFGWSWPVNQTFQDRAIALASEKGIPGTTIESATTTSLLAALSRSLRDKDLKSIATISTELYKISSGEPSQVLVGFEHDVQGDLHPPKEL